MPRPKIPFADAIKPSALRHSTRREQKLKFDKPRPEYQTDDIWLLRDGRFTVSHTKGIRK